MILLALAAAAATPGQLHTYKDWIVGCDNLRTCQANALASDGGDGDTLMLVISRVGAPAAPATLDVPLPDKTAPGTHFELAIDGTVVATFAAQSDYSATVPLTRPLLTALVNGQQIALRKVGTASGTEASLSGLAAALLYIDDQQKRTGTVSALKATGARPDGSVPPPPSEPQVDTPARSAKPPRTISIRQANALIGPENATCDYPDRTVTPEAHRLDATHSVVLINHPCGNGAYNYFSSVYVLDESGQPRPAQFDVAPDMSQEREHPVLTNGGWDAKTHTLGSYEKGRGLGDCGTTESYTWDGARFRLIEATTMGECRGSIDFIRVWKARTTN